MSLPISGTINDNQAGILRPRKTATPLIINGEMRISQRGTSNSGVTSEGYHNGPDRWKLVPLGTVTISQSTDTPTGQGFKNSYKIDVTTADTSLASGDNSRFMTFLEGQNLQMFNKGNSNAKNFTIAFWIKSSKTGTYVMELVDDNSRHCCKTYTVSSANTWEKKVVSIPNETSNAIDDDNTLGLQVYWWFAGGSDFTSGTLATAWASKTSANRAVGLNVNCYDSTDNEVYITGIQMEVGDFDSNSIPDFQFEDAGTSLARCQRYFERITTSGGGDSFGAGVLFSATQGRLDIRYSTVKRANATITFGSAGNFLLQAGNKSQATSSLSSAGSSLHGFFCHTANTGFTIGHGCVLLDNSTTDATIDASSEL